jgi:hypothetical protein
LPLFVVDGPPRLHDEDTAAARSRASVSVFFIYEFPDVVQAFTLARA